MDDLLGRDFSLGEKNARDRCLDQLLAHQPALFSHLQARWRDRFGARLEVLPGHTSDKTTRREFPRKIQAPYGKADRIWIMDRGIPTEEVLAEMRASTPPVCDLVGTPRGRRGQLEAALLERPWPQGREGVEAKLLPQEGELSVLARRRERVGKERARRRPQFRALWARLVPLRGRKLQARELLFKLGEARARWRAAWRLIGLELPAARSQGAVRFSFRLNQLAAIQMLDVHFPATDGRTPAAPWSCPAPPSRKPTKES